MTPLPEKIEDGQELDVQIAPFGDWECHDGNPANKGRMQLVDDEAINQMIRNMDGEILVDIDHKSFDKGETEAAAWITKLFKDPSKGLMARFKFTRKGAEMVSDRAYRFTSPTWTFDKNRRPLQILSVALTNTPNLPVRAMLNARVVDTAFKNAKNTFKNAPKNKDGSLDGEKPKAPTGANLSVPENPLTNPKNERSPHMDELKTVLGLAPEATDADIANAVKALKAKNDELEQGKKKAEAEQFAAQNANKGLAADILKQAYLDAPQVAKNMVAGLKDVTPAATKDPVCFAKNATTPDLAAVKNARAGLAACKTPQERCAFVMKHHAELAETND